MIHIHPRAYIADKANITLPRPKSHHSQRRDSKDRKSGVTFADASPTKTPSEGRETHDEDLSITIREGAVLHPFSKIDAAHLVATDSSSKPPGKIEIGKEVVMWERASIVPSASTTTVGGIHACSRGAEDAPGVVVGPYSTLGPCTTIFYSRDSSEPSTVMGRGVTISTGAKVGAGVRLGDGVFVSPGTDVPACLCVEDGGVVMDTPGEMSGKGAVNVRYPVQNGDVHKLRVIREAGEERYRAVQRRLVKGNMGGGEKYG